MKRILLLMVIVGNPLALIAQETSHRVLATNRTSTMQTEMQQAGSDGYRFAAVMGGETAVGGKEVVVVMQKPSASAGKFEYRLLATSKTSTMEKELKELADAGYEAIDLTVGKTALGGSELVVITRRRAK